MFSPWTSEHRHVPRMPMHKSGPDSRFKSRKILKQNNIREEIFSNAYVFLKRIKTLSGWTVEASCPLTDTPQQQFNPKTRNVFWPELYLYCTDSWKSNATLPCYLSVDLLTLTSTTFYWYSHEDNRWARLVITFGNIRQTIIFSANSVFR